MFKQNIRIWWIFETTTNLVHPLSCDHDLSKPHFWGILQYSIYSPLLSLNNSSFSPETVHLKLLLTSFKGCALYCWFFLTLCKETLHLLWHSRKDISDKLARGRKPFSHWKTNGWILQSHTHLLDLFRMMAYSTS